MTFFKNRSISKLKKIVYIPVYKHVNSHITRSKSIKNALSSVWRANERYKSIVKCRDRSCIVTILFVNKLQKHAIDFVTIFLELTIWFAVLYKCLAVPFAVRTSVKGLHACFNLLFTK